MGPTGEGTFIGIAGFGGKMEMFAVSRFRRCHWGLVGALLVLAVSISCSSREQSMEARLRIGVLGPFTGPAARTGEEFKGSVKMAFEAIDYRIGNLPVELVWIDSQSDPQKAVAAYEEAVIRDRIDAGLLNWHSSVAVAVMEIAGRHRVPHFFGMGATEIVNEKYHSAPDRYGYWMAKGWPIPARLTYAYVQAVEDAIARQLWRPKSRRVAIWGEDTDWGRSLGAGIRKQLEGASWQVVSEDYFRLSETDFYPLLARIKNSDVSLMAGTSTSPANISAFVKQAREVRAPGLIIANGLGWVGEWYSLIGDSSDGVLDQIPGWTSPQAKRFAEQFERKWNMKPSPASAGLSYDYANFFIKIARRTLEDQGRIDREALFKTGRELLMTGRLTYSEGIVMREYKYTPESAPDPVLGEGNFLFPVLQYKSGQGRIIWPPAWKDADMEAPN